jgi:hypothetical protein
LVDAVLAALVRRGVKITSLQSGEVVQVGYHHSLIAE